MTGPWDVVVDTVRRPVYGRHLRQSHLVKNEEDSLDDVGGVVGRKVECEAVDIDIDVTVTGALWF